MREAGFVDVRIEPVTHGVAVEDVDRFWSETVGAMAPITLLKRNSSSEDWAKTRRRRSTACAVPYPTCPRN